ncbi:glycerol-3-phosphate dehydrogenase, partial [Enterococcus faecium]
VATTKAAVELAQQLGVEMPITQTIYNVLYNGEDIKKAAKEIMLRDGKMENEFSLR